MAATPAEHTHLRLVGGDDGLAARWAQRLKPEHAAADIATENRRAASNPDLQPTDPRWVLAARAYSQLQGSTLTPERRKRVLTTAARLGVRPFDANVIIAIVQDHARTGRSLESAEPTLKLLTAPEKRAPTSAAATRWLAALVVASAANLLLIWWVLSG